MNQIIAAGKKHILLAMYVVLLGNFILRWGFAMEWENPESVDDYSWYTKYDFHILPIVAFRMYASFSSVLQCRGFAFIFTSFSHVDYHWRTNFYEGERVNLRLADHDLSSWMAILKPTLMHISRLLGCRWGN